MADIFSSEVSPSRLPICFLLNLSGRKYRKKYWQLIQRTDATLCTNISLAAGVHPQKET